MERRDRILPPESERRCRRCGWLDTVPDHLAVSEATDEQRTSDGAEDWSASASASLNEGAVKVDAIGSRLIRKTIGEIAGDGSNGLAECMPAVALDQ
ncbi:hypothetical protein D9M68_851840 [compost metagenome]